METRLTINQLEKMKTHELADMLANVVLLLRRMPDVECKQFLRQVPDNQHVEEPAFGQVAAPASSFTREELVGKTLPELRPLAKKLNVRGHATLKKDPLISEILARAADGHSEQWAIQDM